jgi:hypothetical protein
MKDRWGERERDGKKDQKLPTSSCVNVNLKALKMKDVNLRK